MNENFVIQGRRYGDCLISVTQTNRSEELLIKDMNSNAMDLLHTDEGDFQDKPLEMILDKNTYNSIKESIEFKEDGINLEDITNKLNKMPIKLANGQFIDMKVKTFTVSSTPSVVIYEILMRKITNVDKVNVLIECMENREIEPMLEIHTAESMSLSMNLILDFCMHHKMSISFCLIDSGNIAAKQEFVKKLKNNVRNTDLFGFIPDTNNYKIGLVLFDCQPQHTANIVNRLLEITERVSSISYLVNCQIYPSFKEIIKSSELQYNTTTYKNN